MTAEKKTPSAGGAAEGAGHVAISTPSLARTKEPGFNNSGRSNLDAALAYAAAGLAVFPCVGKAPDVLRAPSGFKSGSLIDKMIRDWWTSDPKLNIGIVAPAGQYFLDVDVYAHPKLQPLVDRLRELDTPTQRSGGGGWHFLFRGEPPDPKALLLHYKVDPVPAKSGRLVLKGIDIKAHGKGYVVAAPSRHPDTGNLYQWIKRFDGPVADTPIWLLELRGKPRGDATVDFPEVRPRAARPNDAEVLQALYTVPPTCGRAEWISVGQGLRHQFGDDGWPHFLAWSRLAPEGPEGDKSRPYWGEAYTRQTWESFGQHDAEPDAHLATGNSVIKLAREYRARGSVPGAGTGSDAHQIAVVKFADFIRPAKPLEYLIKPFMPVNGHGLIFAPRETGKSAVAIGQACAVATGQLWCGHSTQAGLVLYVCAEGIDGMRMRARAWADRYFSKPGQGPDAVNMLFVPMPLTFFEASACDALVSAVEAQIGSETRPALVVIDTFARNIAGADENSNKDMAIVMSNVDGIRARWTPCTVLWLGHPGHTEKGRMRGASSIEPAADFIYKLALQGVRPELDPEAQEVADLLGQAIPVGEPRVMTCVKMKDAAKPPPLRLALLQVSPRGLDATTVIVEQETVAEFITDQQQRLRTPKAERQLGDLLRGIAEGMGRVQLKRHLDSKSNNGVDQLRAEAVRSGLLSKVGDRYEVTEAGLRHAGLPPPRRR